jgi:histone deacetylase complex subunit SAP18
MRQAGVVHSSRPGADDAASLRALKFQTGDFLCAAVY